jgi:hypothetical protein
MRLRAEKGAPLTPAEERRIFSGHHWYTMVDLPSRLEGGLLGLKCRREDPPIPLSSKYDQKGFCKPEYWRLRGKLDVPKERFIS